MAKRKRRSKSALVAAATVAAIKARKRAFLREVSSLLSDALGFPVRVSMVPAPVDLSPSERRAARRPARVNRAQVRASAELLNSPLPVRSAPSPDYAAVMAEWFGDEEPDGS